MEMNMTNNMEIGNMDSKLVENQNLESVSLLSFDDVVLSKIISHLGIDDLANLAGTCNRLQSLTQQHAGKYYSKIEWATDPGVNNPSDFENVFKHFGRQIKTVKLVNWNDETFRDVLVIVASNCKNLETLILYGILMLNQFLFEEPSIKLMFSKLKRFELDTCHWSFFCPLNSFFGENSTLEKLSVVRCDVFRQYNSNLQLIGFQALKELQLRHCRDVVLENELEEFFRYNNITNLVISDVSNIMPLVSHLVDYLFNKVESLTIDFSNHLNVDQLVRFCKLKILRLRCREESNVDQLLLKLGSDNIIEELEIKKILISRKTIAALENFKNLKRLRFDYANNRFHRLFFTNLPKMFPNIEVLVYTHSTITDCGILYLLKMMPNLKRLSLFGCNPLAKETFFEMEKILLDNWRQHKLELIPPNFETFRLKDINIFTKILVE